MAILEGKPIYCGGNDDEPEQIVQRKNATTGVLEPATGLATLTFFFSATSTGAAIDGTLSKTAIERGATGIYYCTMEGTDIESKLNTVTYLGKFVYQVFGDSANIRYVVKRKVTLVRPLSTDL